MCSIDVSILINGVDPFDLSASRAERGQNAGHETWANALGAAKENPLRVDDPERVRQFFAEFGAWEDEEIEGWSDGELHALVLQMAAGDLRESQSLAPGEGTADVDWSEAGQLSQSGTCSGRLYASEDKLWFDASN